VRRDIGATLSALFALASVTHGARAQEVATVLTSTRPDAWIAPNDSFHVVIRRPDATRSARLAAVLGTTDVTALFTAHGDTLTYRAHPIGLPAGENELTVYLVDDLTGWIRHGAVPLRVRNRAGFERASIDPALVFSSKGQLGGEPRSTPDVRHAPLEDLSVTAGLQSMHTREGVSLRTQSNILGASNREETLRFAERPLDAPKVDLVDYIVTVERGSGSVSLGHVGFGQHRHLINGFASRGASASAKWGSIATLSLAALNGTTVVGFSNPTGISEPDHRVAGGSLALELLPHRPGGLRVEATAVDGSILPVAGFQRSAITDAEASEGIGFRFHASDAGQRLRLESGFSRSRSDYLPDAALSAGPRLPGITRVGRSAWYADLTTDLLREVAVAGIPLALAMTLRSERVDPLYRSVPLSVRSDVGSTEMDVNGSIGAVALRATVARLRDNLSDIPSLLTTDTKAASFGLEVPVGSLVRQAAWFPSISVAVQRIHQAGRNVPVNSGFTETHVPDQLSAVATVALQWMTNLWQLRVQANQSDQDNRQVGRESADLLNSSYVLSLGVTPSPRVTLTMDVGIDGARNAESGEHLRTGRWSATTRLQPFAATTLSATYANTSAAERSFGVEQANNDLRVEWQQQLPFVRLSRGNVPQAFVRYARQDFSSSGPIVDAIRQRSWSMNTGLTIPIR
jgi:hypothetical protein